MDRKYVEEAFRDDELWKEGDLTDFNDDEIWWEDQDA